MHGHAAAGEEPDAHRRGRQLRTCVQAPPQTAAAGAEREGCAEERKRGVAIGAHAHGLDGDCGGREKHTEPEQPGGGRAQRSARCTRWRADTAQCDPADAHPEGPTRRERHGARPRQALDGEIVGGDEDAQVGQGVSGPAGERSDSHAGIHSAQLAADQGHPQGEVEAHNRAEARQGQRGGAQTPAHVSQGSQGQRQAQPGLLDPQRGQEGQDGRGRREGAAALQNAQLASSASTAASSPPRADT